MPEMTMTVRWPDGREQECYSPSLVLHDYLAPGSYPVAEFERRSLQALEVASARVKEKFGFACTSAAATAAQIRHAAARYAPADAVTVVRLWPPLPGAAR
ncbi:MSMEG_0570 family nitrogen starvation response protein [Nocardioides sp.]|uniref:MSMEG_0570 family nitrogen starvation response protein n=1 Tax=Nocardioides sp. TaxID=35761 RepID=UPI003515D18B